MGSFDVAYVARAARGPGIRDRFPGPRRGDVTGCSKGSSGPWDPRLGADDVPVARAARGPGNPRRYSPAYTPLACFAVARAARGPGNPRPLISYVAMPSSDMWQGESKRLPNWWQGQLGALGIRDSASRRRSTSLTTRRWQGQLGALGSETLGAPPDRAARGPGIRDSDPADLGPRPSAGWKLVTLTLCGKGSSGLWDPRQ